MKSEVQVFVSNVQVFGSVVFCSRGSEYNSFFPRSPGLFVAQFFDHFFAEIDSCSYI